MEIEPAGRVPSQRKVHKIEKEGGGEPWMAGVRSWGVLKKLVLMMTEEDSVLLPSQGSEMRGGATKEMAHRREDRHGIFPRER